MLPQHLVYIAVDHRLTSVDGYWTKESWTTQGVRAKVGATHFPLPALMHAFLDAGLTLERFAEGGAPTGRPTLRIAVARGGSGRACRVRLSTTRSKAFSHSAGRSSRSAATY